MEALFLDLASLAMFACAAVVGVLVASFLASRETVPPDGPRVGDVNPLWALAIMLAVAIGLLARHMPPLSMAIIALACIPLLAAWFVDARTGIVPDVCTLLPLAVAVIAAIATGHYVSIFSAFVVFVPFALAAIFSRGIGMGWGDVKLAAYCAILIGLTAALLAFAVACLAAMIVAYRRDKGKTPIGFGPYLVVTTLLAIGLTVSP